jgi:predicted small lipoprotein YifL
MYAAGGGPVHPGGGGVNLTRVAARQMVPAMRTVLVLVVSLAALAACGLRGDLERPVPLWGDPPNEGPNDPRTLKAEEERAAAERAANEERERAEAEAERRALEAQTVPPAAPPQPAQPVTPQPTPQKA